MDPVPPPSCACATCVRSVSSIKAELRINNVIMRVFRVPTILTSGEIVVISVNEIYINYTSNFKYI